MAKPVLWAVICCTVETPSHIISLVRVILLTGFAALTGKMLNCCRVGGIQHLSSARGFRSHAGCPK